jgi:predicted O-methyltransferase YrrM
MSEFFDIIRLETGPIKYEIRPLFDGTIKNWYVGMVGHDFPRSAYIDEFEYLKKLIIDYDLKNGYELGTAFGLTAVALGIGFKQTGGKLVTMDAYIEEIVENLDDYRWDNPQINFDSEGLKSVKFLIEHFGLKDNVKIEVGYSPNDVGKILVKNLDHKLDFVFIDAGHYPEQLIKDIESVYPFIQNECVIAIHDCFDNLITPEVQEYIIQKFGKEIEVVVPYPKGFNLGVIIKKIKNDFRFQ